MPAYALDYAVVDLTLSFWTLYTARLLPKSQLRSFHRRYLGRHRSAEYGAVAPAFPQRPRRPLVDAATPKRIHALRPNLEFENSFAFATGLFDHANGTVHRIFLLSARGWATTLPPVPCALPTPQTPVWLAPIISAQNVFDLRPHVKPIHAHDHNTYPA